MSDQQHIRELAELTNPFLNGQVDDLAPRNEEMWQRHKQAVEVEALVPGVFQEPPPEANPLASAAMIYLTATAAVSPLLEDLAATHMSRGKKVDMPLKPERPVRKPGNGAPADPDED